MSSNSGESSKTGSSQVISATLTIPVAARKRKCGASWKDVCDKWGFEIVRERVVYVGRNSDVEESAEEHFVVSVVRPHGSASNLADRSSARRAGLKVGDIVLSLAGKSNLSPKELYMLLKETQDELQIYVQRRKNKSGGGSNEIKSNMERVAVQIPKAETDNAVAEAVGESDAKSDPTNRSFHESSDNDGPGTSVATSGQSSSAQQPDSRRTLKPAPDVGPGWKIYEVERKGDIKSKGRVDRYWMSPSGKKFRSSKEIERYKEAFKATNGDENAAWSAAKSPSRTKAGVSTTGASSNVTCDARMPQDLLRLIDLYEDWNAAGKQKKSQLNGYIYNCKGGKSERIESANIVDVAEILYQIQIQRKNVRGGDTMGADPDQLLIEANKLCREAVEEEASFLQSISDEISRVDEAATTASASSLVLRPTKAENENESSRVGRKEGVITEARSEASEGRSEKAIDRPPSIQPDIEPISAETTISPISAGTYSSVSSICATTPEVRPRNESHNGEKVKPKPKAALSSGITYGAKKVGSGSSKNTRQKRLWPDSFIFRKRVMKWCPPDVVKQAGGPVRFLGPLRQQVRTRGVSIDATNDADAPQSAETQSTALAPIPSTIHTVAEMLKVMSPHILEEGRAQVNRDYEENSDAENFWTRTAYEATLVTCTPVERKSSSSSAQRVYEFGFHLPEKELSRIQNNIDDLFVIHATKWESIACIGMVGPRDEHTTTYLKDQRHMDGPKASVRLWITASKNPCDGTGWLAQSDVPAVIPGGGIESERAYIMYIGSASDIMRQYEGMKSLSFVKDHLQRAVFCSGDAGKRNRTASMDSVGAIEAGEPSTSTLSKPATIPDYVWRQIGDSLNQVQLRSIHRIMEGKSRENVALLQGPRKFVVDVFLLSQQHQFF